MEIKDITLQGVKKGYKVSDTGKVYGIFGRELKCKKKGKRISVTLRTIDNTQKFYQVSRLVALVFCNRAKNLSDIPIEELEVHHIDKNPSNNSKDNLLWLTKEEHLLIHQEDGLNAHQPVIQLVGNKIVGIYPSFKSAAKATGIPIQNISDAATGKVRKVGNKVKKRKTAGGFIWTQKLEGYYEVSLL